MDTIYVKARKMTVVEERQRIIIKDLADIYCDAKIKSEIENLEVLYVNQEKKKNILVSIFDLIKVINNKYPNISISNVGESDIILSYRPNKEKINKLLVFMKVSFVSVILFCGCAVAIMTFQTDAALPDVFVQLTEIFIGETEIPILIGISYSIGIAVGIIVFFNHFSSKMLSDDPTPIEVELRMYEKDVEDCIIETLIEEEEKNDN